MKCLAVLLMLAMTVPAVAQYISDYCTVNSAGKMTCTGYSSSTMAPEGHCFGNYINYSLDIG